MNEKYILKNETPHKLGTCINLHICDNLEEVSVHCESVNDVMYKVDISLLDWEDADSIMSYIEARDEDLVKRYEIGKMFQLRGRIQ